jgi:hypothetical protein
MKIEVEQGDVHVNIVKVLQKTEEVIYLIVDTRDKRPRVECLGSDEEECAFHITTAHPDPHDKLTSIYVREVGSDWKLLTDEGRYHVKIALVKEAEKDKFADDDWWTPMEEAEEC